MLRLFLLWLFFETGLFFLGFALFGGQIFFLQIHTSHKVIVDEIVVLNHADYNRLSYIFLCFFLGLFLSRRLTLNMVIIPNQELKAR